jgi:hypothetical protein
MRSKELQQKPQLQFTQENGNTESLEQCLAFCLTLLTERETARRLSVSPHALRYWRAHGGGPPWIRLGERLIRYDLAALRKWVEERAGVDNAR